MKKSENPTNLSFGIVLPRLWNLPTTLQTNHNYSGLFEKFNDGRFYAWIMKHPVWFHRFYQCKRGEADIFLCFKDTRTPFAWLDPEKIDAFQIEFNFDYSLKVRKSEKEWFVFRDTEKLAQAMGFPSVTEYIGYISKYNQRYSQAYFLCLTEKRISDDFVHVEDV